jgi:hypothetical protein
MLFFMLGLVVGCFMGLFISALCVIAKQVDYDYDNYTRSD